MIKGILARTTWKSRLPLIDDLSHHMLIVASASLQMNDKETTIASLIHDFFKGLMLWYPKNGWRWYHFSKNKEHYFEILKDLNANISRVAEIIVNHHSDSQNPIKQIESSDLVKQVESRYFLFPEVTYSNFLRQIQIRLSGKYRPAITSVIHEYLTKILSKTYANRFEEIIGVRTIRYIYTPVEDSPVIKSEEDASRFVNRLNLDQFRLDINGNRLNIKLPVTKVFGDEFFIEYNDEKTEICIENDKIVGVRVSYGDALSMLVLGGTGDGALIYVNSGFEINLKDIVNRILSELKMLEKNKMVEFKKVRLRVDDIVKSIQGLYSGDRSCVFCGEKANVKYDFGKRFTDTHQMLFSSNYICPACLFGFFLEDKGYREFKIPQPAYILKTALQNTIPIEDGIALNIAGNFWLKVLSELWFDLVSRKDGYKYANQILSPKYVLSPLIISYAPQFMYPSVKGSGSGKKKFILESSLRHGIVCWGSESDLTIDEFSEIVKFVEDHEDKVSECLRALRNVYSIRSLPNPPKRGGRSVRKSRKRKKE